MESRIFAKLTLRLESLLRISKTIRKLGDVVMRAQVLEDCWRACAQHGTFTDHHAHPHEHAHMK